MNITNECNLELMKRFPDNHFDLAIVDPPYGIGKFTSSAHTNGNGKRIKNKPKLYGDDYKWNNSIPSKDYFDELFRVSKKRIIWGANYYPFIDGSGGCVIWYKGDMMKTMSSCEIASLSFQAKVDYIPINWQSGFYRKLKEGEQIHPCQKPIQLYEWLLYTYAKPGDKILDTHLGSGSIAIACDILGYDLTACEINKEYYNSALFRLKQFKAQLNLFK